MSASLTCSNTLGVPALADRLEVVRSEEQLPALLAELRRTAGNAAPITVLGGGSNVVLLERVPGVVLLIRTRGFRLAPGPEQSIEITAAAGERWHDLVRFSLGQGLAGLENLALIPGSVGAAPIQNIGAYGIELADRFVRLAAVNLRSGERREFDRAACRFGYRDSIFKHPEGSGWLILEVTLRLHRTSPPVIGYPDLALELTRQGRRSPSASDIAEAVIRIRRRKLPDPRRVGNVGSFFKNPEVTPARAEVLVRLLPSLQQRPGAAGAVKLSAAQLIDAAGWKGRTVGAVGVWQRQPLVLVNRGGARGRDVLAMGEDIRRDVAERFGVILEMEPQVVGQD
jgi:UDP-N-acetylmuramate dehydrogenase